MTATKPATPLPFHRPLDMCDAENVQSLMLSQPAAMFVRHGALDVVAVVLMPGHGQNPAGKIAEQRATHIVTACNAYPQLLEDRRRLVEALRDAVEELSSLREDEISAGKVAKHRALLAKLEAA